MFHTYLTKLLVLHFCLFASDYILLLQCVVKSSKKYNTNILYNHKCHLTYSQYVFTDKGKNENVKKKMESGCIWRVFGTLLSNIA